MTCDGRRRDTASRTWNRWDMFFCTSRTYFEAYSFTNFASVRSFLQRTIHRRLTFFKFLAFLDEDGVSFGRRGDGKWASLDPSGAEGFHLRRLVGSQRKRIPMILSTELKLSFAALTCAHVGMFGPLAIGALAPPRLKTWGTAILYASLNSTVKSLRMLMLKIANGSSLSWYFFELMIWRSCLRWPRFVPQSAERLLQSIYSSIIIM